MPASRHRTGAQSPKRTPKPSVLPFFDFRLDLENEGKLLCLRLIGEPGIKPFIRAEFHVPAG